MTGEENNLTTEQEAYEFGLQDGRDGTITRGFGYTWDDPKLNEAYDRGANAGEAEAIAHHGILHILPG